MSNDVEIFNYLNLINPKLGKICKANSFNPFPLDFVVTEEKIKRQLLLNQISCEKIPEFVFEDKRKLKKIYKNSRKNVKKMLKNIKNYEFSADFLEYLEIYLNLRYFLTKYILKNSKNQNFVEEESFIDLFSLDPILSDLLFELFSDDFDYNSITDLEKQYNLNYEKKIKLIEKKNNQKSKNYAKKLGLENLNKTKNNEKTQKNIKISKNNEKISENNKKSINKSIKNKIEDKEKQ